MNYHFVILLPRPPPAPSIAPTTKKERLGSGFSVFGFLSEPVNTTTIKKSPSTKMMDARLIGRPTKTGPPDRPISQCPQPADEKRRTCAGRFNGCVKTTWELRHRFTSFFSLSPLFLLPSSSRSLSLLVERFAFI